MCLAFTAAFCHADDAATGIELPVSETVRQWAARMPLQHSYRFDANSGIGELARLANAGDGGRR